MAELPNRRQFIQISLGAAVGVSLLGGCKSEAKTLSCADTTGLEPMDLQIRTALGYVDHTTMPEKRCDNCVQYVPGAANTCGSCKLMKGPIHPDGYCKTWAAKPA